MIRQFITSGIVVWEFLGGNRSWQAWLIALTRALPARRSGSFVFTWKKHKARPSKATAASDIQSMLYSPAAFHIVMENFISILTLRLASVSHSFSFSPKLPEISGEPTSVNSSRGEWGRRRGLDKLAGELRISGNHRGVLPFNSSLLFAASFNIRVKVASSSSRTESPVFLLHEQRCID